MSEITELQSADHRRQRAISDLLETDRRRREEMRELRAADRTRQQQIIQTLTAVQTLQRETIPLQGLVTTLQGQVTALQGQVMTLQGQVTVLQGQQGPAGGPAQPELPEDTGSTLIDQGVAAAMAEAEASRARNGYNSNALSNCPSTSQVKFATCTLQDDALTWWNAHVKTTTTEAAHAMPWAALKKMMTDKYCPRQLAVEVFRRMIPRRGREHIEKYNRDARYERGSGLKASKSKTMQEVIEFTTEF
ncbi:hypothetical protein Tco_1213687 [Tanacetum coccineum]